MEAKDRYTDIMRKAQDLERACWNIIQNAQNVKAAYSAIEKAVTINTDDRGGEITAEICDRTSETFQNIARKAKTLVMINTSKEN